MRISILGGAGFLGRKVAARLTRDNKLGDTPITSLTLFDIAAPPKPTRRSRSTPSPVTSSISPPTRSRLTPT